MCVQLVRPDAERRTEQQEAVAALRRPHPSRERQRARVLHRRPFERPHVGGVANDAHIERRVVRDQRRAAGELEEFCAHMWPLWCVRNVSGTDPVEHDVKGGKEVRRLEDQRLQNVDLSSIAVLHCAKLARGPSDRGRLEVDEDPLFSHSLVPRVLSQPSLSLARTNGPVPRAAVAFASGSGPLYRPAGSVEHPVDEDAASLGIQHRLGRREHLDAQVDGARTFLIAGAGGCPSKMRRPLPATSRDVRSESHDPSRGEGLDARRRHPFGAAGDARA